ncbi:hypothetical protein HA402_005011 [Bradysia odoriphaga]|nr:hypothetical protein HA402_005011 [Bradysia odoriphaga]
MSCKLVSCLVLFFVFAVSDKSNAHTYHSGECPLVEPMSGFDMSQFLGIWYAVQKTSTASSCLIYNITRGSEPGEYLIEQTSQHFALGLTPLKHEYSYTGEITVPHRDVPAKMQVKFPLNVAGESSFTVFMTDYLTYAGIFSCQKVAFTHRQSATLLSRTRTLDKMYIDKMRTRLASHSVDPFDLSIISQTDCPKDASEGYNIHIDPDTFSAANVANVFRKAGEKIGDGVEWTIDATKKAYNKLTNSTPVTDAENKDKIMHQPQTGEQDAEWVRFK